MHYVPTSLILLVIIRCTEMVTLLAVLEGGGEAALTLRIIDRRDNIAHAISTACIILVHWFQPSFLKSKSMSCTIVKIVSENLPLQKGRVLPRGSLGRLYLPL